MEKAKSIIAGFDVGGAHLKVARAENGRIVAAVTIATPLWLGLDKLTAAFDEAAPLYAGADLNAFTMTGELSDIFPSREAGVAALLDRSRTHFPDGEKLIYAGRSGFVEARTGRAAKHGRSLGQLACDGPLVAKLAGNAVFVEWVPRPRTSSRSRRAPSPTRATPTPNGC